MRRVTVPAARLQRWLAGFVERHGETEQTTTDTELHLVGADGAQAWLTAPFPPLSEHASLVEHLQIDRRVGVLLVRRGGYAVGVFAGRQLVASKVGSRYVQGTTKAGGWSQQRFARRRANQARQAFADAADAAAVHVLPYGSGLDAVVCGGDRGGVDAVLTDHRLKSLADLVTGRLFAVPDPRLAVLKEMPERYLSVEVRLEP